MLVLLVVGPQRACGVIPAAPWTEHPTNLMGVRADVPADSSISIYSYSGSRKAAWMRHLASWTEVAQPFPTHFDSKGNTVSRLDRAFVACPISLLLKLNFGCSVVGTPEEIFANGDSDHAPVAICFGRCFRPPCL